MQTVSEGRDETYQSRHSESAVAASVTRHIFTSDFYILLHKLTHSFNLKQLSEYLSNSLLDVYKAHKLRASIPLLFA